MGPRQRLLPPPWRAAPLLCQTPPPQHTQTCLSEMFATLVPLIPTWGALGTIGSPQGEAAKRRDTGEAFAVMRGRLSRPPCWERFQQPHGPVLVGSLASCRGRPSGRLCIPESRLGRLVFCRCWTRHTERVQRLALWLALAAPFDRRRCGPCRLCLGSRVSCAPPPPSPPRPLAATVWRLWSRPRRPPLPTGGCTCRRPGAPRAVATAHENGAAWGRLLACRSHRTRQRGGRTRRLSGPAAADYRQVRRPRLES